MKDFLSHHPLISTPSAYEVHFFDDNEEYAKGIEYYRSLMPRTQASQVTFEKTPKYMVIPEVPKSRGTDSVRQRFVKAENEGLKQDSASLKIFGYRKTLSNRKF